MIARLERGDWEAWRRLWDAYLRFYRAELDEQTTRTSFERLSDGAEGMRGLLAHDAAGEAVGIAHLVLHPATWTSTCYCYLEDLYVDPSARGSGIAEALIRAVYEEADAAGATRVYWHTQEFNGRARSLYDTLAHRTSFVMYER